MKPEYLTRRVLIFLILGLVLSSCSPGPKPPIKTGQPAKKIIFTPTVLAEINNTPNASEKKDQYAFHMSYAIDESVRCASGVVCDSVYIPKAILYFRGDFSVQKGEISGQGSIFFIGIEGCQTLRADLSNCKIAGGKKGSFEISGQAQGDKASINLSLKEVPKISLIMVTKTPSGYIEIPFESTYADNYKKLFENSGLWNNPFEATLTSQGNSVIKNFEGTITASLKDNSASRSVHGFGGLIFIPVGTGLPAPVFN
jgi:hypothetical protein